MKRKPIEKEKFTHRSLRRNSLENAAGLVFTGSREAVFNFEGLVPRDDANKRIDLLKIDIPIKFTSFNSVILVSDSSRLKVYYNTHNQSIHLHNSIINYIIDFVFLPYQI